MPSLKRRTLLGGVAAAALASFGGTFALRSQAAERVVQVRAHKFTYEPDEPPSLNEP
jgi:hypothetical protein